MTVKMNFTTSKDSEEKCLMHSKSDNREIMSDFDKEDIIEELIHSLLQSYHVGLEQSMKVSSVLLDYVKGYFYKCYKVSFNPDGSYIDSPKWLQNKIVTINL